MDGINYTVKRASDAGKSRLITDTDFLLKFAFIQNNLNTQEQAEVFIADNTPKKEAEKSAARSADQQELDRLKVEEAKERQEERKELKRREQEQEEASLPEKLWRNWRWVRDIF